MFGLSGTGKGFAGAKPFDSHSHDQLAAAMPAIAPDLNDILLRGFLAMITAIGGISCRRTTARIMFAFIIVCHNQPPDMFFCN